MGRVRILHYPKIAIATLVLHLIYGAVLELGFKNLKTNTSPGTLNSNMNDKEK